MAVRVLLVSGRTEIAQALADDPGAALYFLERRLPEHVDETAAGEFQVVLVDLDQRPDGVALGKAMRSANRELEWIVLASHATERQAVEALKSGAFDYLIWPADVADFWAVPGRAVRELAPPTVAPLPRPLAR